MDEQPLKASSEIPLDPPQQTMRSLLSKDSKKIDDMLSQVINLNNDNEMHEPTCAICSSAIRKDAEEVWDHTHKNKDIIKLFEERTGLAISRDVVENHMLNHKSGGIKEIQKVEYIDRIKRLYGKNTTTLDKIDFCLSILTERVMGVNSLVPNSNQSASDIEKIKSSETARLMAQFGNFCKLQATIMGEMKDQGELISIPKDKFVNVFHTAIANANNDRERQLIKDILDGLKNMG